MTDLKPAIERLGGKETPMNKEITLSLLKKAKEVGNTKLIEHLEKIVKELEYER